MPENNGKQNPDESYPNKYYNYVICSYGYKLVCVDDQLSKPFKSHLGQDDVHKFINNMVKESKYCSQVIKKHFNKELVITKEDDENFETSTKCWICDYTFVESNVKVRDHCHVTGKYRSAAHRDCNINVSLN